MQGLCTLAGRLLQHRAGQPAMRYAVLRGDVRARRLAFAGDELWLSADHVRDRGAEVAICCRATLGEGAIVGELDLWLAPEDA
jgi:hypothetical protein